MIPTPAHCCHLSPPPSPTLLTHHHHHHPPIFLILAQPKKNPKKNQQTKKAGNTQIRWPPPEPCRSISGTQTKENKIKVKKSHWNRRYESLRTLNRRRLHSWKRLTMAWLEAQWFRTGGFGSRSRSGGQRGTEGGRQLRFTNGCATRKWFCRLEGGWSWVILGLVLWLSWLGLIVDQDRKRRKERAWWERRKRWWGKLGGRQWWPREGVGGGGYVGSFRSINIHGLIL